MWRPSKAITLDRRRLIAAGFAVLSGCGVAALPAATSPARKRMGAIVGNDPAALDRFTRWFGRAPDHVLLALNQSSWDELDHSITYVVDAGRAMIAKGVGVQWSIPIGGWGKYEDVTAGKVDALYTRAAGAILAATPDHHGKIVVRPPWEFNGDFQSQRAKSWKGAWDPALYQQGYRRIAGLFRAASPRFVFDWCPNIGTEGLDPTLCYPGDDLVDIVSVDVYYRAKYDDKGLNDAGRSIFAYRRIEPNGLDWLDNLARSHNKLIGISEWGADSGATAFVDGLADWLAALGPRLSHHNYWDRSDGDAETAISDGGNAAVGAAFKRAFA